MTFDENNPKNRRLTGDRKNLKMTRQSARKGRPAKTLVDPTLTAEDVADEATMAANDAAHVTTGNDYPVIPGVDRNNQPRT
jgi:hypothetical protein